VSLKRILRWLAALAVVDGLLLLAGGRSYVRLWQAVPGPLYYRRCETWFTGLPAWLLRLAGCGETALGLALLSRARYDAEELYQQWSGSYDTISLAWRWWLFPAPQRTFDETLARYLRPGGRVLDLGCGTGANLERLLALNLPFGAYVGVDQSEAMLSRARAKLGDVERASFQQLDLISDPLPEGPFDLVVSSWVFSHLPDTRLAVEKAMDRLGDEGYAILMFLAQPGTWSDALVAPLLAFFSARGVPRETYSTFPGRVLLEEFLGGRIVAMVLRKGI
jgi:SAM-dependent methyltransferase